MMDKISWTTEGDILTLSFSGQFTAMAAETRYIECKKAIQSLPACKKMLLVDAGISSWDSGLLAFIRLICRQQQQRGCIPDFSHMPKDIQELLKMAGFEAVAHATSARSSNIITSTLNGLGAATLHLYHDAHSCLDFIGNTCIALWRFASGKARFPVKDFVWFVQITGVDALPIITLISLLIGMVLAYVGAVELRQFGAQIYVADMVGLGMSREMGAMMTAIIMAGRSGAAFAAQLGTMEVNEEIDAFKTLGLRPYEYLVLPRMLALTLMLPLLCIFADVIGVAGGALVGCLAMDLNLAQYINRTGLAVTMTDFFIGVGKSAVFGLLVALAGCWRGLQCGRSAAAVGAVTTEAVVTSLVLIVVFDAIITVTLSYLGI